MDVRNSVLGKEQGTEAGLKRKVAKLANVIVGEVYGVVVLGHMLASSSRAVVQTNTRPTYSRCAHVFNGRYLVT